MLRVEDLRASYGRIPVLQGIDFSAAEGECIGVLGHNGMGKTTLMRTIAGQINSISGAIRLDGIDITGLPPHERARRGLGYVPQGRAIFPTLSVNENLWMGTYSARRSDDVLDRALTVFPGTSAYPWTAGRGLERRRAANPGDRTLPLRHPSRDAA